MGGDRPAKRPADIDDAVAMSEEAVLITPAHGIDIADQRPAVGLLEVIEADPPLERQVLLGRVQDLEEMAAYAEPGKAAQTRLQRLQRGEEIADHDDPRVVGQRLTGRQVGVALTGRAVDRAGQVVIEAAEPDAPADRPASGAQQGDALTGTDQKDGKGPGQ